MPPPRHPEEFFEVFRRAQKERSQKGAPPGAPQEAPPPEPGAPGPPPAAPPKPAPVTNPVPVAKPTPLAQPAPQRKLTSVFAENEPTVTIGRSTLIIVIIIGLILLFIAYRLGRASVRSSSPRSGVTARPDGVVTVSAPALPDELRNKCAVRMKLLDHTQDAGPPNARTYRDFLNSAPDAAFIGQAAKKAFILAYDRELAVCVGPFDRLDSPDLAVLLPRLRTLRYQSVQHFANASVEPLPPHARLFQ